MAVALSSGSTGPTANRSKLGAKRMNLLNHFTWFVTECVFGRFGEMHFRQDLILEFPPRPSWLSKYRGISFAKSADSGL